MATNDVAAAELFTIQQILTACFSGAPNKPIVLTRQWTELHLQIWGDRRHRRLSLFLIFLICCFISKLERIESLAEKGRGHVPRLERLYPGCAPADQMGQNKEGTHYFLQVPQSKFWCPGCVPAAEKFRRRDCIKCD